MFVSYLSMMDITYDSPDCALISFLNLFCQLTLSELSGSLLRFLLLTARCFFIEALPSFDPCHDVSSSLCSLDRYINSCQLCQQMSNPVLPHPENVNAETLTGFCFVGLDFVDLRYG